MPPAPARKSRVGSLSVGEMTNWNKSSPSASATTEQHRSQQQQNIVYNSDDSSEDNEGIESSGESSSSSSTTTAEERRSMLSIPNLRKRPMSSNTSKQAVNYKTTSSSKQSSSSSAEVRNKLALMRFSDIFQREGEGKKDDKSNSSTATTTTTTPDKTGPGDIVLNSEESDDDESVAALAAITRPTPTKKQKLSSSTVDNASKTTTTTGSASSEGTAPTKTLKSSTATGSSTSSSGGSSSKKTLTLEPKSILFKFVCSCTTVTEIRYALQEDFEDEKHVSSRRKHNMKAPSRKGRLSAEDIKFIRKYYDMTKHIRLSKYHITLNTFKDVESFEDGIVRTWEESKEDEVNISNIKHFVATILGRSFELITTQWKNFEKKDDVWHVNFVLYLEQMRYHFEEAPQVPTRHSDHDEEIIEIFQSILIQMKKYIEQVNAKRSGKDFNVKELKKMEELLDEHYSRLEDYLHFYNEQLHEALWKASLKLMKK